MTNLIRKCFPALAISLAVSGAVVSTGTAAMRGRHVPDAVAHLRSLGHIANTNLLHLSIGLPARNTALMQQMLKDVYDPKSTNYQKFLTTEQFTTLFGPTEADYQAVINYAQQNGLTVEHTHASRMVVDVVGRAPAAERAFRVSLQTYQHPTENRKFFAPDNEPSVPDAVAIQDVSGLDNYRRPRPHIHSAVIVKNNNGTIVKPNVIPNAGSGFGGLYIGEDFRNAYASGAALKGSGQSVALVQFDGYLASDIAQYCSMAGRTNIPLVNILFNGFSGSPTFTGGEVEVSLDIEMVTSMAPALDRIYVYEGNPFNFHPNDVLSQIADDNVAKQVGCSWGWTGGPNGTTEQIFVQMALQGQTFFNASGDSDAFLPGQVDDPSFFGTPSASPNITQVGGTTLTMSGNGATWSSEVVWNAGGGEGSSGGFSTFYPRPYWQTNINMAPVGGSATGRNIPDVAMVGDGVLVVADGGSIFSVGGTSVAAPLWAGFTALVNQLAASNAKAPVGFINPALYGFANSVKYTNVFHDITVGNNTSPNSPSLFFAAANYDLCTGLGTPYGTNLIFALAGTTNPVTHIPPPPPPYGTTLSALTGGDPNGDWSLFVIDSQDFDSGVISNGWLLTLTTADIVGKSSDVGISMTVSTNTVAVGDKLVYYIAVTNYGPSVASNVLIADSLPLNADYLSNSVTAGSITLGANALNWDLGTLNTNAGASMTITVRANAAGDVTDGAIVTTTTADENPDDNSATATASSIIVITQPVQLLGSYIGGGGGGFTITGTNTLGTTIIIQGSTNLIDWLSLFTNTPPPPEFNFVDHDATNYPMRFYRSITGP